MPDLVTNRAEKSAIIKRFQSYENDSMAYSRDHFEENKREESCELQGGRLNFYERDKPGDNTVTTVVEVEKRRGTNTLILRCGPGGRTVIFLEFDSKRLTDEWQEALCRYTGQTHVPNPALRRVKSELPAVLKRRKRRARSRSSYPDCSDEQVDSEQVEVSSETPHEAPPEAPQEARVISFTSETNETDSLRSLDAYIIPKHADLAKESVEKECTLSDLQQLKFMDCEGDVIVKEGRPHCQLLVGDKILFRDARGLAMSAQELTEHIRTSIVLTIARGAVCTVREEGNELGINIKGSQAVRLDTVDLIRRAFTSPCFLHYADIPEISNLTITEINNIPVAIGSHPDQIAESMRGALETSGGKLTLHLVPQSLMDYLAEEDDDTHEEQG